MGHRLATASVLNRLSLLKDPNAWVCLIAVFVILGLMGGAFEPAEHDRIRDAGMSEGAALEVALAKQAATNQPG